MLLFLVRSLQKLYTWETRAEAQAYLKKLSQRDFGQTLRIVKFTLSNKKYSSLDKFGTYAHFLFLNMLKPQYPYQNTSLKNIKGERWKDIPGFEGEYQLSNYGRLKSLDRWVDRGKYECFRPGRIRKLKKNGTAGTDLFTLLHKHGKLSVRHGVLQARGYAACVLIYLTRLLLAMGSSVSSTGNFSSVSME